MATPTFEEAMVSPGYTSCYCEENVFHLVRKLLALEGETCAAFISNALKACPVWEEQRSVPPSKAAVWDYHVVALFKTNAFVASWVVFDLDSRLPWPCPVTDYVSSAFRPGSVRPEYIQSFRILDGASFVSRFSSDRSHMRSADGSFLKPPPPCPLICGLDARSSNELPKFLDFSPTAAAATPARGAVVGHHYSVLPLEKDDWYGELLSLDRFCTRFA
jgi:protein N-terminal glutamine amidohydrolase